MKKTFKTLIAVILAMIIATGSISAFAAKETVILDYIDEKYEYFYGSQLTEGKNSIDLSGDELYYYHDFKAEKDGYYIIETNPMHIWWIAVAEETSSGRYIDEALTDYTNISYEEENEKNILFLEKGTYIFFTDKNEEFNGKTTFGIEYAGAEITGFDFEGGVKYSLLAYSDIYSEYFDETEKYYGFFNPGKTTLTFDSGKTCNIDLWYQMFKSDSEITEGENTIAIEFAGKTFEKTVLVHGIEYYVKSVEVKNFDEFDTVEAYYDGCIKDDNVDFTGLEFVVEFTNGEKKTVVADDLYTEIELPDGNPSPVEIYYEYDQDDNGNACFYLWVHGEEYAVLPVETVEVSAFENMSHLAEENTIVISEESDEIFWDYINILTSAGTDEFWDEFRNLFEDFFTFIPDIMKGIFSNVALFFGF